MYSFFNFLYIYYFSCIVFSIFYTYKVKKKKFIGSFFKDIVKWTDPSHYISLQGR